MRRFRSRRKKPELNADINVTNLVDVALTILIVFMLIAPLIEHSLRVQLPKAQEKEITERAQMTVEIAPGNKLYVNNVQVTLAQLADTLSVHPNISVNVQGDASVSYQELVDVLDAIRQAGVTRVGLATEVKVGD
jgi:biopolymer transport protein ExbD